MEQKHTIVYCTQHMVPHDSEWCSVHSKDKIPLNAKTMKEAIEECKLKGLKLYQS